MAAASDRQLAALSPKDRNAVVNGALDVMIGRGLPGAGEVTREKIDKKDCGTYWRFKDLLRIPARGEELPVIFLHPKGREWNGRVVVWLDGAGKAGLFGADGAPIPAVKRLLEGGSAVLAGDLLHQGDFLAEGRALAQQPLVKNPREYAGFTYGYNSPLLAKRVHDALTLVAFVKYDEHAAKEIWLVGANGAAPVAALARARAGTAVSQAFVDTRGFRFGALKSYRDPDFLPGALKYGDLPGLLALSAPQPLTLLGEGGKVPDEVLAAYAGTPGTVRSLSGSLDDVLK